VKVDYSLGGEGLRRQVLRKAEKRDGFHYLPHINLYSTKTEYSKLFEFKTRVKGT
jgi:hypothetical protein